MKDSLKDVRPEHLRHVLGDPVATHSSEEEEGLPSLHDGEYRPHARPSNKQVHALHFVKPDGRIKTFEYADMRSRCAGDGDDDFDGVSFKLAFLGVRAMEVTVTGRGLSRLYDYVHQHRVGWIMQSVRDFAEDGQTIVTAVTFMEVGKEDPAAK